MKKLILHIGRHKSGTTAIQRFLRKNGDFLTSNGFYYPQTGTRGAAHHEISEPMQRRYTRQNKQFSPDSNPLLAQLRDEIAAADQQKIILSSEAFQNCDPPS